MTPDGRVGARGEIGGVKYRSQRMWTKKRQIAYRRHKAIEKLNGPTDFKFVLEHENFVPEKPRLMRTRTYRRIKRRLGAAPQPESIPLNQ
jgi:hypothetical protein